ncbi:MAG: bifunctional oligoribonuclease/PAP phosphatase NrnA [Acaryochloridaceae cyanobacterium RL_2_7]|nr:bifunctional oligoribonuclease/PAP phosphatase NrnA [Acaryochloridaceae cyanobacterium RL_2_7]
MKERIKSDEQVHSEDITSSNSENSSVEDLEAAIADSAVPRGRITGSRKRNRQKDQRLDTFREVLEAHRNEDHLIVLQDFPDPDALSSAWVYKLIAEQYDIQTEIVYAGTLSHQENIALVRLTNLPVARWQSNKSSDRDLTKYQGCVLIDNQGTTSQILPLLQEATIPVVAIIDHHSLQENVNAEFVDVRTNTRATATIMIQYIRDGLLTLDSSIPEHVNCATALMHGLRSDTNSLLQAQEEDFLAAGYISRFLDSQLLNTVLRSNRSKQVMDVIDRSLRNRKVNNNFTLAGVGYLRYDDRDAIPQAADFLVTEENVHTAVVYGIIRAEAGEPEVLVGSLRTTKLTLDPDEFIKEAFGTDTQGRFFGGGRSMAGGFEIPIGFLSGANEHPDFAQLKWDVFDTQIQQKLLRLIDPDSSSSQK